VRALVRNAEKAADVLGKQPGLEVSSAPYYLKNANRHHPTGVPSGLRAAHCAFATDLNDIFSAGR